MWVLFLCPIHVVALYWSAAQTVLEELETILKKLKLKQNFKLYKHNIYSDFRGHECFVQTVYMTENHSSDKVVTV